MREAQARQRSDAELVKSALEGSEEAYAQLVRRYQDLLYRHAERMAGSPDEAEDIVQLAFIKAYRNLASCQNPNHVGAWMFRITANACKDHLKARRGDGIAIDDVPGLTSDAGDPEHELDRLDLRSRIDSALRRLPADQREAFVMKHVEGMSYQEMEELLGVSVPALKMRVHRARDDLQELLEVERHDRD
jgi:RNA polymerase sigma-70 factor (ECF subfamily)